MENKRQNISRHRSRSESCSASVFSMASDRKRSHRELALSAKEYHGDRSRTGTGEVGSLGA